MPRGNKTGPDGTFVDCVPPENTFSYLRPRPRWGLRYPRFSFGPRRRGRRGRW